MPLTVLSSDTLEKNREANTNLILELKKFSDTAANPGIKYNNSKSASDVF